MLAIFEVITASLTYMHQARLEGMEASTSPAGLDARGPNCNATNIPIQVMTSLTNPEYIFERSVDHTTRNDAFPSLVNHLNIFNNMSTINIADLYPDMSSQNNKTSSIISDSQFLQNYPIIRTTANTPSLPLSITTEHCTTKETEDTRITEKSLQYESKNRDCSSSTRPTLQDRIRHKLGVSKDTRECETICYPTCVSNENLSHDLSTTASNISDVATSQDQSQVNGRQIELSALIQNRWLKSNASTQPTVHPEHKEHCDAYPSNKKRKIEHTRIDNIFSHEHSNDVNGNKSAVSKTFKHNEVFQRWGQNITSSEKSDKSSIIKDVELKINKSESDSSSTTLEKAQTTTDKKKTLRKWLKARASTCFSKPKDDQCEENSTSQCSVNGNPTSHSDNTETCQTNGGPTTCKEDTPVEGVEVSSTKSRPTRLRPKNYR